MGRPAAAALTNLVRGAVGAARAGHSSERLRLQLEFSGNGGEGAVDAAGYRLTESDRRYRLQWLDTVGTPQTASPDLTSSQAQLYTSIIRLTSTFSRLPVVSKQQFFLHSWTCLPAPCRCI